MASISRIGVTKLGYNNLIKRLCKVTATNNVMQMAFINGKAKRAEQPPRLPAFDYLNKDYGFWAQLFDPMVDRMDSNSKVIVIEGPIAAGKSKLAEKIAEEFDMIYLPPPTFDEFYINEYGYDIRTLDDRLSRSTQSCDVERFLTDPHHPNVPMFQFHYFQFKFDQYITTLLHLFSTGQGVVLDRSFYTDYIFATAMANAGYMRPVALKFYNEIVTIAKAQMLRPHLIIYLDVPVNAVKEKIKKRRIPYEVNSKVLTTEYLTDIENMYKLDYLKNISEHSHVLIYDWTNEGDVSTVIEDIEFLDFDKFSKKDKKMSDWTFENVQEMRTKRQYYENRAILHMDYTRNEFDCPELSWTPQQCEELYHAMKLVPGDKYAAGFNMDLKDKIFFKTKLEGHRTLRRTPREIEVIKEMFEKRLSIAA